MWLVNPSVSGVYMRTALRSMLCITGDALVSVENDRPRRDEMSLYVRRDVPVCPCPKHSVSGVGGRVANTMSASSAVGGLRLVLAIATPGPGVPLCRRSGTFKFRDQRSLTRSAAGPW